MRLFRADLHCHSTCSDGTLTPEELVHQAIQGGLSGLSITDHDTQASYETALPLAKKLGLRMISGIEFSTHHMGSTIHILAYSFQLNHPLLKEFCEKHAQRREIRNKAILKKLNQKGVLVTYEDILEIAHFYQTKTIGRPHIALALMKKNYVESPQEAFKKYLGENGSCYEQGNSFSIEETLRVIKEAKGFAVIAHPHLISKQNVAKSLFNMPFDGIECYYAKFNAEQNIPWLKLAKEKNWLITGGSDFHGTVKPGNTLGSSWTPEDSFQILEERFFQNDL